MADGIASDKLSVGQYRILDGKDSYGYSSMSFKRSSQLYRAKLNLPYISGYRGHEGLANASIKLSYLSTWEKTFVDLNYRQKLATANKELTVPVRDAGFSIGLSRYLFGGVGFAELGYTWRNTAQAKHSKRKNSFYYSLGGLYSVLPKLSAGLVVDHKPTALGRNDRSITMFTQSKLTKNQRLTLSMAAGLSSASPESILGLAWANKF